jgi:hypothetical protein
MTARALLEELREQDIRLEADGLSLRVDAPVGTVTGDLRITLVQNKHFLIRLLERERKRLEEAGRRGLVIKWSKEPGYISLHDPTTGEWHEVRQSECSPSIVESARTHRRRMGERR